MGIKRKRLTENLKTRLESVLEYVMAREMESPTNCTALRCPRIQDRGFVVGSHLAYWKPAFGWVGVWLKLAADHHNFQHGGTS
jgi:hypothetical protein